MSYNSKYTGTQVEEFLDQIANGEIGGGSSVYKWNWNFEMNGTFTEEEFENLSNADVVYITTGVGDMEMLYSVDVRAVVEDALHLGVHALSFETDTDNSKVAYVESITFIFDNSSKTWSAQGGDAELITNEQLTSALEDKQDKITDLDAIRSGAEKGATALQSVPSEYVTETELTNKGYATTSDLDKKVDKISGKQLSTEDFTTALKIKLEGLSNYDDTELSEALSTLRGDFDKLVSGDTTTAIKTFNEVIAFLDGVQDTQDLSSIIASIEQQIAGKMDKVTLATVATSGSYNDLSNKPTIPSEQVNADWNATSGKAQILNKPTIPSAVTESTVSGWGFTKNTGTYSKPSGGIPKTDLASAVQTSLGKADTALQSYTEQYKGTVTGVKINGSTKNPSSGVVDLGTVITAHQDISGKQDKLVSGTNIKTINGESILGSGDLTIEGGAKVYEWFYDDESESVTLSQEEYDNIVGADIVVVNVGGIWSCIVNKSGKEFSEAIGEYALTGQIDMQGIKMLLNIRIIISTKLATITIEEQNVPTKTSQLENDSNFITSDNLKTINGQSIIGSGNIEISGGGGSSSGSGAYAEVNHGTSDTTFTLTPNTFHIWEEVSALTLTLGSETAGVANEFLFQFNSGATATSLSLPSDLKWANDAPPTIVENKIYQVSILNGMASVLEFSNTQLILINFTIGGTQYQAEEGMSWNLWCNSQYNTDFEIDGGQIWKDSRYYISLNGMPETSSSIIIDGTSYELIDDW